MKQKAQTDCRHSATDGSDVDLDTWRQSVAAIDCSNLDHGGCGNFWQKTLVPKRTDQVRTLASMLEAEEPDLLVVRDEWGVEGSEPLKQY